MISKKVLDRLCEKYDLHDPSFSELEVVQREEIIQGIAFLPWVLVGLSVVFVFIMTVGKASAESPDFKPYSWNEYRKQNSSEQVTSHFYSKWVNFFDGKNWNPINVNPRTVSGAFVVTDAPYSVSLPLRANGKIKMVNTNKYSVLRDALDTSENISKDKVWLTAKNVEGVVSGPSVLYRGAFDFGDLVFDFHEQEIRSIVKISSNPSGFQDLEIPFEETYSTNVVLKNKLKTTVGGAEVDLSSGIVAENGNKVLNTKQAYAWDSSEIPRYVKIKLLCHLATDKLLCKKVIPRTFLDSAIYPIFTDTTTTFAPSGYEGDFEILAASWTGVRDAGTAGALYTSSPIWIYSSSSDGSPYANYRYFFSVDTSSIPDTDIISSAFFNFTVNHLYTNATDINIVGATPSTPSSLTTADYDALSYTSYGSIAMASLVDESASNLDLNSTGLTAISKTGVSSFALITEKDRSNTAPTSGNYGIKIYTTAQAGTSLDPYFSVTYAAPASSSSSSSSSSPSSSSGSTLPDNQLIHTGRFECSGYGVVTAGTTVCASWSSNSVGGSCASYSTANTKECNQWEMYQDSDTFIGYLDALSLKIQHFIISLLIGSVFFVIIIGVVRWVFVTMWPKRLCRKISIRK